MKNHRRRAIAQFCLCLVIFGFDSGSAQAQGAKPRTGGRPLEKSEKAEGAGVIRIRKFTGVGRQALERTPEYKTSAARGLKPSGEWAQVSVVYDTEPDWIDELIFQYYVMTMKVGEDGKKEYSVFKNVVKYADIEKGRDHNSAVFLRPTTLKRYGAVVAAGVEISHEGKIIAEKSEVDPEARNTVPEKWWTEARVLESKSLTVRDGYLLDRAQTPFALINIDDYEVTK